MGCDLYKVLLVFLLVVSFKPSSIMTLVALEGALTGFEDLAILIE